jgi:hypothetical protein
MGVGSSGRGTIEFDETYSRLLTRIENFPDWERIVRRWALSRDDLEGLLGAYLALCSQVDASITALKRQIDHEIDTQERAEVSTDAVFETSTA